jgi:hypothetical protein
VMAWLSQIPEVPAPQAPPGLGELANTLLSWLAWGVAISGVTGLLICAGMIILGRRSRNQMAIDGLMGAVWVFGGLALAGSAGVLVNAVAAGGG